MLYNLIINIAYCISILSQDHVDNTTFMMLVHFVIHRYAVHYVNGKMTFQIRAQETIDDQILQPSMSYPL